MEFKYEQHRIYLEDENGQMIAEIDFPMVEEGVVNFNHTYVSDVLRGQGVAGKLMTAAIEVVVKNGWKMRTSCSYAAGWMAKHPERADLLAR